MPSNSLVLAAPGLVCSVLSCFPSAAPAVVSHTCISSVQSWGTPNKKAVPKTLQVTPIEEERKINRSESKTMEALDIAA